MLPLKNVVSLVNLKISKDGHIPFKQKIVTLCLFK